MAEFGRRLHMRPQMRQTLRFSAVILLSVLLLGPAAWGQAKVSYEEALQSWKGDLREFFRASSELGRKTEEGKEAFYAEHGIDGKIWQRLVGELYGWVRTPEGFAAAQQQIADQLTPVDGLSLEHYGQVGARLAGGQELGAALATIEYPAAKWEASEKGWLERMRQDPTLVLTTLYSHHFLNAVQGPYAEIAHDAARGMLPGGQLTGPEPVSYERYVELGTALHVAARNGKEAEAVLAEFDLDVVGWSAISNWWGVRERHAIDKKDYQLVQQRTGLSRKYQPLMEKRFGGS